MISRGGETGNRDSLRRYWEKSLVGSNPTFGTIALLKFKNQNEK